MGIGYYPKRPFKEPQVSPLFKPKPYTWFISLISIIGYIGVFFFVLFGVLILSFRSLRGVYFNWAIASFISAFLLYTISYNLISNYGAKYFYNFEKYYSFKSPLGRSFIIPKDDIIHIKVRHPNPLLQILPLVSPTVIIATYDYLYKFQTSRWQSEEELVSYFEALSQSVHDEFAEFYHRSKSILYSFLIRLSQDTWGMIGLTIITIFSFMALWGAFAMLISPTGAAYANTLFLRNPDFGNGDLEGYDWDSARFHPPSSDFWFGTDFVGRDIFARLVYGTTYTFMIALAGSLISMTIILVLGYSSALYPGWWDSAVMRVSDALLTFPPFVPLILISTLSITIRTSIPGGYFLAVFTGMAFFTWPLGARIIRSEVIELLNSEYVSAVKQMGGSKFYILSRHIISKTVPTILILFTYTFTDIILGTTLLGFIGLDSESTLTWGSDLAKAVKFSEDYLQRWWTIFFPTLWIFVLVFGLTIFSDSIRDTLDPRLRGGLEAVPYEMRLEEAI